MKNIKRQTVINRRIWPMCKVKKHDWNFAVGSVNPTADVIIRWRCRQGYKTSTGTPYAITFYAKSWGPFTKYYTNYKFPIFYASSISIFLIVIKKYIIQIFLNRYTRTITDYYFLIKRLSFIYKKY